MTTEKDTQPTVSTGAYFLLRSWEKKNTELRTSQKREAKAIVWGVFGERKCFLCGGGLIPQELQKSYTLHHELAMGSPDCNRLQYLHLAHLSCNSKHGPPNTSKNRRKDNGIQTGREREKIARVNSQGIVPNRTHEEIVHTEILPLVKRFVIKKVQEGWVALLTLKRQGEVDMVIDNSESLRKAVKCLKYGVMCAAAANEYKIGIQTAYHWMFVWKNEINGFLYVGDFEQGKLLDFTDPEDHKRMIEDVYSRYAE